MYYSRRNYLPWQFLYFFLLPHGQRAFLPTTGIEVEVNDEGSFVNWLGFVKSIHSTEGVLKEKTVSPFTLVIAKSPRVIISIPISISVLGSRFA